MLLISTCRRTNWESYGQQRIGSEESADARRTWGIAYTK